MENLTYVTGNYGKYISVKEKFEKAHIDIDYFKYDLEEPNVNDIEFIIFSEFFKIGFFSINKGFVSGYLIKYPHLYVKFFLVNKKELFYF